ncbi:hypothetical protein QFC24_006814 [Naganishia onofrii]|uniref:Uncharacterized protein n=1 Tax=Naganishia onofrii TaxID=1851511 RepID=A0ACC2WXM9_9TREE|nr:hypothetical protein QFC24_006814 [Naganishia onofrii]
MANFYLSATLAGHSQDVRSLHASSATTIISGSRDASAIVWKASKDTDKKWEAARTIADPDGRFVSSVGSVRIGDESYIAVGSQSSTISLWSSTDTDAAQPAHTLIGHKHNVCALDSNDAGLIVSGSWDKTAIVWRNFKPILHLKNHEQAVWAVKCIGDDRFLTASADKLIRLFDMNGKVLQTYQGHTDCVRALSLTSDGKGFFSAANDGYVKLPSMTLSGNVILWSFDNPRPVQVLNGHTSFVYSVATLPNGEGAVSSGEDGTVRVWTNGQLSQTITHPTVSVWVVDVLPNGDIASGASDGVVRVWTRSEERKANTGQVQELEKAVASRQLNKTQVGDIKHTDLPGMEGLSRPGKKDGEVLMIKNNGKVEAYQWSSAGTTWQQIGEVTDAVGSGRKQVYQGIEYDYVFDVDIAEGQPPLKLPYNVRENPYDAAQKFLSNNELPMTYVDQVVKFIESNTGGVSLGSGSSAPAGYVDPFTGGSRYQPAGNGASAGAGFSDPFTGGGAYRPGQSSTSDGSAGTDPFTGGGYRAQSETVVKSFSPIKVPQYFKAINVDAARTKINEFSSASGASLSQAEQKTLNEVYSQLKLPGIASLDAGFSENYDPATLLALVMNWPEDKRFPLIDLCRVLCVSSVSLPQYQSPTGQSLVELLLQACAFDSEWPAGGSKPRDVNTMLVVRALANLTATEAGRKALTNEQLSELLEHLAGRHPFTTFNKNTRVAFATLALNLSILAMDGTLPVKHGRALLQYISNILSSESEDSEVAYRAIVALGNLVRRTVFENVFLCVAHVPSSGKVASPSVSGILEVGDVEVAKELASGIANMIGEQRLKDIARQI